MRIAVLSPRFRPRFCGVSDYTAQLARSLNLSGQDVKIWTSENSVEPLSGIEIESTHRPWNGWLFFILIRSLRKWKPDVILIQYTPQSIAPRMLGVWPAFPFWLALMRKVLGKKTAVIAHELNYPVNMSLR